MVDATEGIIGIEWIQGNSVRNLLPGGAEEEEEVLYEEAGHEVVRDNVDDDNPLLEYGITVGAQHTTCP